MFGVAVLLLTAFAALVPGQPAPSPLDPASGDPVAALAEARAAVKRAPLELGPALDLARAFTALGRAEDALSAFARARALAPVGAKSSGTASAGVGEQASAYLVPALLLRDLDRTGEAIQLLEEAAERRLGSADIYEQLALLRLADGLVEGALAAVAAAAAESVESPGLDLARGLALARHPHRRGEALGYLRRALDSGVGDPVVVRLEAAELLSADGRYPEAIEHLHTVAEFAPAEPEVFYRLGRTLAAAGDREAARAALERHRSLQDALGRAVEIELAASADLAAALSEAQGLAAAGDLDEALSLLFSLDGRLEEPGAADLHSLRAKVLFSMGRVDEAAASIALARKREPNRVEHHYLEGMFLHTGGRAEEAASALERAVALDPGLGEAHALLGVIAAEAGRPAEAAERMGQALEQGLDDNAPLRFNYARVLEALGRSEEAKAQMDAFERLRQLPPQ